MVGFGSCAQSCDSCNGFLTPLRIVLGLGLRSIKNIRILLETYYGVSRFPALPILRTGLRFYNFLSSAQQGMLWFWYIWSTLTTIFTLTLHKTNQWWYPLSWIWIVFFIQTILKYSIMTLILHKTYQWWHHEPPSWIQDKTFPTRLIVTVPYQYVCV